MNLYCISSFEATGTNIQVDIGMLSTHILLDVTVSDYIFGYYHFSEKEANFILISSCTFM